MSTSRLEKFIYAICSMEVSDLPAPLSRIEILWNCLITGETPDFEPQSRNEQYLMAMLGLYELENLPTPMSRGEKLLYKIAMGETDLSDIPAYLSRYEELLGYLAENGGVGDFEYILQTLNQRLSTLYSTKERPMKQAVIKGDTLVNELPRPSLKNTMTNVGMQKLNQGYDNGKTLVNLVSDGNVKKEIGRSVFSKAKYVFDKAMTETYNECLLLFTVSEYIKDYKFYVSFNAANEYGITYMTNRDNGIIKVKVDFNGVKGGTTSGTIADNLLIFHTNSSDDPIGYVNDVLLIPYQDGMENWDIPYFEGTKTFSATPNVVDGEFKQAVVKGQTLVNIKGEETFEISYEGVPNHNFLIPLVKKNTDYLIKYDTTLSDGLLAIGFLNNKNSWSKNLEKQPSSGLVKLNSGANPNYFRLIGTKNVTLCINNLMIIEYQEGMENWDIPYFEGMQSVQLSAVTTTGKNLHHGENMSNGYVATNGNIDRGNISNSLSDYIKVEPSTSYAYKCFVENQTSIYGEFAFYDEDKKFISVLYAHHTSDTCIITPDNCHYLRVWNNQYTNNGDSHPNVMLVKTTNLPSTLIYEPYQSNTLTLAESVTLRKVGDVEDEFDALTGQVTERIGEITFNGSEQWSLGTKEANNTIRFKTVLQANIPAVNEMIPTISSNFPSLKNGDIDIESIQLWGRSKDFNVRILKTKASTVDEFKQYLQQNPITLQYPLATETTRTVNPTITDQDGATQTKLHSFNDGHLSVSSQGLLPSAVNYEVPTNNSYYLPDILTLGAQYTSRGSADCNATIDGKLLALGKNKTFTTPSSVTNRLMVLDAPVDDLMFIKGDHTAKDFGYFEGMKSVEINGIQVTGKNLFDGVSYIDGYIFGGGNTKVKPDNNVTSILVNLEKNTNYILSTKTSFDRSIIGGSTTPISINSYVNVIDCKKIDSRILFNSGEYTYFIIYLNNGKIELTDLQVEKGSVATPYEPYQSTTLTLNEPVTLRKVGKVQDTLDGLTGEVTERIGEIVLDGSGFYVNNQDETSITFVKDGNPTIAFMNRCINNRFSNLLYVNGTIQINVNRSEFADINEFKESMAQNNLIIQLHKKDESIKTVDLTTVDQDGQPTKLKTFNDITHVEINADNLIPSVDVEVATKISETLATLDPQQLDISNTQNKLGQTIDEQTENTDATMMATTEIYEQTL